MNYTSEISEGHVTIMEDGKAIITCGVFPTEEDAQVFVDEQLAILADAQAEAEAKAAELEAFLNPELPVEEEPSA